MKIIPIKPARQHDSTNQENHSIPDDLFKLSPDKKPTENPNPITVNGQIIADEAIAREAQNHPVPKDKPGWAWQAAAQALVWRALFLEEARQKGIKPRPMELKPGLWETQEEALIRQLFDEAIPAANISDRILREHYAANQNKYRGPSLYEAAHILFTASPNDSVARTEALKKALIVYRQLKAKPHRFAHLAKEHSACPSASQGGLMGQIASGDVVPEFESILRTLEQDEICAPTQTRYGYHIVRLDKRALGQPLPFESVRSDLRQAMEKAHWVKAGKHFMESLLEKSQITGIDMRSSPWALEST